jgi:hypothetical protein
MSNNADLEPDYKHQDIAELAYSLWIDRGESEGSPDEDWFRAEEELAGKMPLL